MGENEEILIIDSSFLVAINYHFDSTYGRAKKVADELSSNALVILPSEVFSETINTLWRKVSKERAQEVAEDINSSEIYTFEQTSTEIRSLALEKFKNQKKGVSFTDCLVMAFADSFKTKKILGFDEAFSQNGYSL